MIENAGKSSFYSIKEGGIELYIRLTPNAKSNKIDSIIQSEEGVRLKISVTAIPEKGKANKALIALLSQTFKIPKTSIHLASGETHRNKTFSLEKLDEVTLKKLLPINI